MKITIDWKQWIWTEIKEEVKEYKRWRAEKWQQYAFISDTWDIEIEKEELHYIDDYRYNTWNYYRLEDEHIAEADKNKLLATTRVNDRIRELNEGWEADWSDRNQSKCCIQFNIDNGLFVDYSYANKKCTVLIEVKTEQIAEQIIKEHEEDLKLIYWIK